MAVLFVRMVFIILSFQIMLKIDWKRFFSSSNTYVAPYLCVFMSLAVGHLVGSFAITIIELCQSILAQVLY
ncbi:DUF1146 family protein [Vaginisenegalia massiliensis]|uniref:DUF1146 family protein n=1 Tax=Vaginisenegalia massiliensis TaxID=2058294 RepID=UPI0013DDD2E1|nr:DUF1146 family protein [Vaginisenegalia massiliensis]